MDRNLLVELFNYNPVTGHFTNRVSRGRAKQGARAGSPSGHGYRCIRIDYEKYYEHHLAWYYEYGIWPGELDHADGNRSNNAIANLRPASRSQNSCNAERKTGSSGLKGAYLDKRVHRWYSKIQLGDVVEWLGHFDTAEQANAAFMTAVELHHGKFAFHNRPQPFVRRI